MRKNMKKIMALGLAGVMMLGMSTVAFAANDSGEMTVDSGNTITIPKGIVVTNPDENQKVYTPNVTYKYTATGVSTAATITDSNEVSIQTKEGPTGGLTIPDVTFTSALTSSAVGANGFEIAKPITITVNYNAFTNGAGVYRYTLTESVADADTSNDAADLTSIGMTRVSGYDNARILDVYLQNDPGNTENNNLKLAGYVIAQSSTTNITAGTEDTDITGKNGGFVPGEEGNVQTTVTDHQLTAPVTDESSVDWYHTFNVTLTKETTGTLGDKTKEFTFAQTVVNNGYQFLASETESTAQAGTAAFNSGADVANTMKDGDVLYIRGLNAKATVAYTETNNAPEEYKVTVQGSDNNNLAISVDGATASNTAEQALAATKTAALAATAITDYSASTTAKASITDANHVQAVKYINKLDSISPTGVALRFAPYILMLAGAFFLIAFTRRRRVEE